MSNKRLLNLYQKDIILTKYGKPFGLISRERFLKVYDFAGISKRKELYKTIKDDEEDSISLADLNYIFERRHLILFKCSDDEFNSYLDTSNLPINIIGNRGSIDEVAKKTVFYINNILEKSSFENLLFLNKEESSDIPNFLRNIFSLNISFLKNHTPSEVIEHVQNILISKNIIILNTNNSKSVKIPVQIKKDCDFDGFSMTHDKKSAIFIKNKSAQKEKRYLLTLIINIIFILKNQKNQTLKNVDDFDLASSVLLTEQDINNEFKNVFTKERIEKVSSECKLSPKAIIYRLSSLRKINEIEKSKLLKEFRWNGETNIKKVGGGIKYEKTISHILTKRGLVLLDKIFPQKRDFCINVLNEPSTKRGKDYDSIKKLI